MSTAQKESTEMLLHKHSMTHTHHLDVCCESPHREDNLLRIQTEKDQLPECQIGLMR